VHPLAVLDVGQHERVLGLELLAQGHLLRVRVRVRVRLRLRVRVRVRVSGTTCHACMRPSRLFIIEMRPPPRSPGEG